MARPNVGMLIIIAVLLVLLYLINTTNIVVWMTNPVEKPGPFTVTGLIQDTSWAGSQCVGCGEQYNYYRFELTPDEDGLEPGNKKGWTDSKTGNVLNWEYFAVGKWCGELPYQETHVEISTPDGRMKTVTITDLSSGKMYRFDRNGPCIQPSQ